MATYYTLKLSQVKASDEEVITYLCFEGGASGVSENLDFVQTHDNYEAQTIEKDEKNLDVYFESPPSREFIESLQQKYPLIKIELAEDEEKDWREEWKKGLKAFELVSDIWVVPSWLDKPQEAKDESPR